jgi:alpha-D-ribose 1-methylphosphonate 5-triphosphate synthase subunit PhnH
MLATAFPAPVLANQAVFRALMDALARWFPPLRLRHR